MPLPGNRSTSQAIGNPASNLSPSFRHGLARLGRWLRLASPVAAVAFFGVALWALQELLRAYRYDELLAAVAELPGASLALAAACAGAGYLALTGYDLLAFRCIGRPVPWRRVAVPSLIASTVSFNLGNTLVTGAALRYWLYSAIGLPAAQVARVVLFCSLGFWLGYLWLGGLLFTLDPIQLPAGLHRIGATTRPLGLACLALLALYLGLAWRRRPLGLGSRSLALPSPGLTLGQILVASLDLCLMAAVLYALLPADAGLAYGRFLPLFLMALVGGAVSQVPGGLGVFETVMVLLLSPRVDTGDLAAALLAFRFIYFIFPFALAVLYILVRAGFWRHPAVRRLARAGTRRSGQPVSPALAALACLVGGMLLLFGGSPLIAPSRLAASLLGTALLLLAHGLQRRLDGAWLLAVAALAAITLLALAGAGNGGTALLAGPACLALLASRRHFHRPSALLGEAFTGPWVAAVIVLLAGAAWLALVAHAREIPAARPWWQFAGPGDRAGALPAAVSLAALFALHRLIRPVRPDLPLPGAEDIERARPIVRESAQTYANLVFRGDKALLFSASGRAFLMYGRRGRSWVAMGDPIGPAAEAAELARRFRDLADRHDGWCVFFEVGPERRDLYAALGLALTPLGEEARVDLWQFDLRKPGCKGLRHARAKLAGRGWRFEILPPPAVPAALPALEGVSDAWLAGKATREKGFSTASFDGAYLANFPVAVVRRGPDIIAFANLWPGAGRVELSMDLMRYRPDAPHGTMDFLFSELLLWGRAQGFHWFNFGLAPLAGLDARAESGVWRQIGGFLYRHGRPFYNFEGLRHYKDKFGPVWTPLYLASPGGLALGPILMDVTALMAGGLGGIVAKSPPVPRSRR